MQYPKRIGRRTIPFYHGVFVGHPDEYKFNSTQKRHYEGMKGILAQAGIEMTLLGSELSDGGLTRFVAIAGDPSKPDFIWQKYEGNEPAGGQNRVYVAGRELKVSQFLSMDIFMAVMMCMKTKEPA
jgi:hypothetical protein